MSSEKEMFEHEADILLYHSIFSKDKYRTNDRKVADFVFQTNMKDSFIPVDFLPTIVATATAYPSVRQNMGITWGMRSHHVEFFNEYLTSKPITVYNSEWYEGIRAHIVGNNGFQLPISELRGLIARSYFENNNKKLTGVANPKDFLPGIIATNGGTSMLSNNTLEQIMMHNKLAGISWYCSADFKNTLGIGRTTLLSNSCMSDVKSIENRKIGWCLMLKSEHYDDWYKAVFENQSMAEKNISELASWKSLLSKKVCATKFSGIWKTTVNPDWFVLMVDIFALQAIKASATEFEAIVNSLKILTDSAVKDGIQISYVTNYSLAKFCSKLETNFVKNLGNDMQEHEKRGKELLASISRTLKRASV